MQLDQIQPWLDATQTSEPLCSQATTARNHDDDHNHASKRRRLNPITPSASNQSHRMASPIRSDRPFHKRPLDDETPRAQRIQVRPGAPASSSGLSYDSLASDRAPSSQRSGRLSPKKQLRRLQLDLQGLDVRELATFGDMPEDLETMLDRIAAFSDGKGIVAPAVHGALKDAAASDRGFRWALRGSDHVSDDPVMAAGCTPSPEDVRDAVDAAVECSTRGHPEANWNMNVHAQILRMAFQPGGKCKYTHLVNFMGCTTASILANYGITTLSKKVDFCIYIDPQHDDSSPTFPSAAARARDALPHGIVSFTDFAPLYDRFVALSIETKNPSETFEAARLQLGVWEMARWAFLRRLATAGATDAGGIDKAQQVTAGTTDTIDITETNEVSRKTTTSTNLPSFLPGIIIQGHDWSLVVTTAEGNKTVLWQKVPIGSTSNSRGVYQIVSALQYLERWARDLHWPWLRTMVEAIPEAMPDMDG